MNELLFDNKKAGVRIINNTGLNRVQIYFDDIPAAAVRTDLKKHGWRWSPKNMAWQRQNTENGIADAERIRSAYFPDNVVKDQKANAPVPGEIYEDNGNQSKTRKPEIPEADINTWREQLKAALTVAAVPLTEVDFTRSNYETLFPRAHIETPVESVKLGAHQFEKLDRKNRQKLLAAVYETLAVPDIVFNEERESVFGDTEQVHSYVKSYCIDTKNRAVQSIVVSIEDENVSISTHEKETANIVNKIKTPDQLLFSAVAVGRMIEQHTQKRPVQSVNNRTGDPEYVRALNSHYNASTVLSIDELIKSGKLTVSDNNKQQKNKIPVTHVDRTDILPDDSTPSKQEKDRSTKTVYDRRFLTEHTTAEERTAAERFTRELEEKNGTGSFGYSFDADDLEELLQQWKEAAADNDYRVMYRIHYHLTDAGLDHEAALLAEGKYDDLKKELTGRRAGLASGLTETDNVSYHINRRNHTEREAENGNIHSGSEGKTGGWYQGMEDETDPVPEDGPRPESGGGNTGESIPPERLQNTGEPASAASENGGRTEDQNTGTAGNEFPERTWQEERDGSGTLGDGTMPERWLGADGGERVRDAQQSGDGPRLSVKEIKSVREQCRKLLAEKKDSELTDTDKALLSQYEGAGGLNEKDATASGVLSEFYTPENIVKKVWMLSDAYAPDAVTVLEPAAGTGRFASGRPDNVFTLHEIDETSAHIAGILHPDAAVVRGAYQKQFFDDSGRIRNTGYRQPKYDLVVGNPPYGKYTGTWKGLGEGKEHSRYDEYFIEKGLDALHEGGLLVYVVPSSFLKNKEDSVKQLLASKGKLIDAWRLPANAFPTTAVGTDIIVMQKGPMAIPSLLSGDRWFSLHPDHILGEERKRIGPFGEETYVALPEGKTVSGVLDNIVPLAEYSREPASYSKLSRSIMNYDPGEYLDTRIALDKKQRLLEEREYKSGYSRTVPHTELRSADDYLKNLEDGIRKGSLVPLGDSSYDRDRMLKEIKKFSLSLAVTPHAAQTPEKEPENIPAVGHTGEAQPVKTKAVFTGRDTGNADHLFNVPQKLSAKEFSEYYGKDFDEKELQVWAATAWDGYIDTGKLSSENIRYMENSGRYVEAETGRYMHKMLYASGNIYSKIDELDSIKNRIPEALYRKNLAVLQAALPEQVPVENIHFSPMSTLAREFTITIATETEQGKDSLNVDLSEAFIYWATNCSDKDSGNARQYISNYSYANISEDELPKNISWRDIVDYIDKEPVSARRSLSEQGKKAAAIEAEEKRVSRRETAEKLFDRFIHEGLDTGTKNRLISEWNRRFNNYINPDYSKLPLFISGMSTFKNGKVFKLRPRQISGASYLCRKGNGLLAYDVGVGKTATGIVATVNQLQIERAERPLIVVPKRMYSKWLNDIQELFPDIRVNGLSDFSEAALTPYRNGPHSLNIPSGSISLCTNEALQRITFSDASISGPLFDDFRNLLGIDFDGTERQKKLAEERINEVVGRASQTRGGYVFWEETGFDHITVDEAHRYKNLFKVPRSAGKKDKKREANEYAGLGQGTPSARALKLFGMTQLTQRNNDNRNVFLLTATPFTNSPLEIYSMLSYMARSRLKEMHIYDIRDFLNEYAQMKSEWAVDSKGEIKIKQVMKNFRNLQSLQNLLRDYIDKVDGDEAGIERPVKSVHMDMLDMTESQQQIVERETRRMLDPKSVEHGGILVAMNNMRMAMLSPALVNPSDYDFDIPSDLVESSPKLSFVCNTVAACWKKVPAGGQVIYMPRGVERYDEVKAYLIKQGIPEKSIACISSGISEEKTDNIKESFNDKNNPLKIIIGSETISEGIDLNGNSFALYNTMLGWNPTESIQVEGRVWRQGNLQGQVHIVYPLINDSIDALMFQKHDEKSHRLNDLWSYKGDKLNVEDINPESLKFDLIKDPAKKADFIVSQKTSGLNRDLLVIKSRIESIDTVEEERIKAENLIQAQKKRMSEIEKIYAERPDMISGMQEFSRKQIAAATRHMTVIRKKLDALGLETRDDVDAYIRDLNTQKGSIENEIQSIGDKKDELIKQMQMELLEKKVVEKTVGEKQKELTAAILGGIYPADRKPVKENAVETVHAEKNADRLHEEKTTVSKTERKEQRYTSTGIQLDLFSAVDFNGSDQEEKTPEYRDDKKVSGTSLTARQQISSAEVLVDTDNKIPPVVINGYPVGLPQFSEDVTQAADTGSLLETVNRLLPPDYMKANKHFPPMYEKNGIVHVAVCRTDDNSGTKIPGVLLMTKRQTVTVINQSIYNDKCEKRAAANRKNIGFAAAKLKETGCSAEQKKYYEDIVSGRVTVKKEAVPLPEIAGKDEMSKAQKKYIEACFPEKTNAERFEAYSSLFSELERIQESMYRKPDKKKELDKVPVLKEPVDWDCYTG